MHPSLFSLLFFGNLSSLYKVWYGFFCFKLGRIFLHFIKACPDLPWLDQIYCSGYKLYCRRYWPDLPEMCRKWPRKGKIDRTNNFWQSAFFLRILRLPSNFTLWTLVHYRCFSERPSLEKGGSLESWKKFYPSLALGSSVKENFVDQTFSINFKTNSTAPLFPTRSTKEQKGKAVNIKKENITSALIKITLKIGRFE